MEPQNNQTSSEQIARASLKTVIEPLCKVTPLSKYLAAVVFIVMPFVGAFIGYSLGMQQALDMQLQQPITPINEFSIKNSLGNEMQNSSDKVNTSENQEFTAATNTAYVVAIDSGTDRNSDKKVIVLDYVDTYEGQSAIDMRRKDGLCSDFDERRPCSNPEVGPYIYDRDISSMTQTFKLAPNVVVIIHGVSISLNEFETALQGDNNPYFAYPNTNDGKRVGKLYTISFNENHEVTQIKEIVRP